MGPTQRSWIWVSTVVLSLGLSAGLANAKTLESVKSSEHPLLEVTVRTLQPGVCLVSGLACPTTVVEAE